MFDVHEMQVFVAAAETENFSSAAREMRLSQPAISFQIQALEKKLKVRLFQRVGKRVALTEAGRELLPLARELIYLAADIEEKFAAQKTSLEGRLVIGCGTGLARYLLPHLIGAFGRHYPHVQVSCEGVAAQVTEEKLARREIHLGVVGARVKSKRLDCHPFFSDELVLVAAAQHPWTSRETISPSELGEVEWISDEEDVVASAMLSSNLAKQGVVVETLRVAVQVGDAEALQVAVAAGQGVAFVSRLAAHRNLESGRIQIIQVERMSPVRRNIYLAYLRKGETRVQARFREFIESTEGQSLIAKYALVPQEK